MGGPSVALTPTRNAADDLRPRQPLQARRVPAAVRLPEPDDRRAALLDQRSAAAPVLHEQRFHAAARRAAGAERVRRRAGRRARGSRRRIALSSGAQPTAAEVTAGVEFLRAEPMQAVRGATAEAAKTADSDGRRPRAARGRAPGADRPSTRTSRRAGPMRGDGMMAGVVPGAGAERRRRRCCR